MGHTQDLDQPLDGLLGILQELIPEGGGGGQGKQTPTNIHTGSRSTQTQSRRLLLGRIQSGQLVHDLGAVPQDGVELQEAVQSFLQAIQPLVGQTWDQVDGDKGLMNKLWAETSYDALACRKGDTKVTMGCGLFTCGLLTCVRHYFSTLVYGESDIPPQRVKHVTLNFGFYLRRLTLPASLFSSLYFIMLLL